MRAESCKRRRQWCNHRANVMSSLVTRRVYIIALTCDQYRQPTPLLRHNQRESRSPLPCEEAGRSPTRSGTVVQQLFWITRHSCPAVTSQWRSSSCRFSFVLFEHCDVWRWSARPAPSFDCVSAEIGHLPSILCHYSEPVSFIAGAPTPHSFVLARGVKLVLLQPKGQITNATPAKNQFLKLIKPFLDFLRECFISIFPALICVFFMRCTPSFPTLARFAEMSISSSGIAVKSHSSGSARTLFYLFCFPKTAILAWTNSKCSQSTSVVYGVLLWETTRAQLYCNTLGKKAASRPGF